MRAMRKVIAAINMSLDGFCDHTLKLRDDDIHQLYTDYYVSLAQYYMVE